ncbi:MAG: hypothetical protein IJ800_06535 [Clostridia bacterium]|nr:hypothetical protein [Clostridia bacterium]
MKEIKISDGSEKNVPMTYLSSALTSAAKDFGGEVCLYADKHRKTITVKISDEYEDFLRGEAEDKISDVIAVKYKYDFFVKKIPASGLNEIEREILYSALISADIDEDKRYIARKLRGFYEYAVDGIYNFRLSALKRKWSEIVGYIPPYFPSGRLNDFVSYLIGEKKGKAVTVENGNVYDKHFNLLRRTELTGDISEGRILREALLSGCGELRVLSPVPESEERYLRTYFMGRITFC